MVCKKLSKNFLSLALGLPMLVSCASKGLVSQKDKAINLDSSAVEFAVVKKPKFRLNYRFRPKHQLQTHVPSSETKMKVVRLGPLTPAHKTIVSKPVKINTKHLSHGSWTAHLASHQGLGAKQVAQVRSRDFEQFVNILQSGVKAKKKKPAALTSKLVSPKSVKNPDKKGVKAEIPFWDLMDSPKKSIAKVDTQAAEFSPLDYKGDYSSLISDSVEKVIQREMKKGDKTKKKPRRLLAMNSQLATQVVDGQPVVNGRAPRKQDPFEGLSPDIAKAARKLVKDNQKRKDPPKTDPVADMFSKAFGAQDETGSATIELMSVGLDSVSKGVGIEAEFVFDYNPQDIRSSIGESNIQIDEKFYKSDQLISGVVRSNTHMDTSIHFRPSDYSDGYSVPLLGERFISKHVIDNELVGNGGHVLVATHESIQGIDIDGSYEKRLFLNENFEVVESAEETDYLLYLNVEEGNHLLNYFDQAQKDVAKVIFVRQDTVTFEEALVKQLDETEVKLFSAYTNLEKLFSEEDNFNSVWRMHSKRSGVKKQNNIYEMGPGFIAANLPQAYQVKYKNFDYFVSTRDPEKIVLPNQNKIDLVYRELGLENLDYYCLVQVDFPKSVSEIDYTGLSEMGYMSIDAKYMDEDGTFHDQVGAETVSAFFLSGLRSPKVNFYERGKINFRVEYMDSKVDHFQALCSEKIYWINTL